VVALGKLAFDVYVGSARRARSAVGGVNWPQRVHQIQAQRFCWLIIQPAEYLDRNLPRDAAEFSSTRELIEG
jgi:hypothetical protein